MFFSASSSRRSAFACVPISILVSSCAAHNAHLVRVDSEPDLGVPTREAVDRLVADHGRELSESNTLLAVDVDDVDVLWDVEAAEHGPWTNSQIRDELEIMFVDRMGAALAPAPPEGDYWTAGEFLLQVRMVLDLHPLDALGYQIAAFLIHRDDPEQVIAFGLSEPRNLPRKFCHGCRDHPFREKGTRVLHDRTLGSEAQGYGVFVWTSYGFHHDHGSSGGATYRTTR